MEYNNILIIKMSSLGDVLHTLPFVAVLRERFPKARLTWLVHPQFSSFVPDPPLVDEVIFFDKVKFNKMGLGEKWSYFKAMRRPSRAWQSPTRYLKDNAPRHVCPLRGGRCSRRGSL